MFKNCFVKGGGMPVFMSRIRYESSRLDMIKDGQRSQPLNISLPRKQNRYLNHLAMTQSKLF